MISRKIFENFHTAVAILVLLKQFSGNFCLNSVPLILSVSPIVMVFVLKFSIMRTWGVRIEKIRNYGKIVFIKNMFENGWWGGCIPHIPLDSPLVINCDQTFTSQKANQWKRNNQNIIS